MPWLFDPDQVPDVEGRSAEARFVVFTAVATILRALARERPMCIVLDDLHAADEPSLPLLRFLAAELSAAPVLVVALARGGEGTDAVRTLLAEIAARAQPRIDLAGLGADAVAELVERETGHEPARSLIASISADTGGNPLFVAEVARAIRSGEGMPSGDANPGRPRLSRGLRELIARRIGGLSEACREALLHASVVGREFDLPTLAAAQGRPVGDLFDAIDEAIRVGLLSQVPDEPGRYRFAHALMRETLYDGLAPSARSRMHRDVGTALERQYGDERDAHLAELAHHFFEAIPAEPPDAAARYAELGAARALRDLAYEEATRLYRLALRALDLGVGTPNRRIDDLLGLGEAEGRAGDLDASRVTFRRAYHLARDSGTRERVGMAALGYGGRFGWARQDTNPDLVPMLEQALDELGPADSQLRARLLARLAGAHRDDWSREPRDSMSAEAVDIARRVGDAETLAFALETRFRCIWWVDNPEARLAIGEELVELASHLHDRERIFEAHLARSDVLWELGRIGEAMPELDIAARAAEELGQPAQLNMILSNRSVDAIRSGRLAEAEDLTSRAVLIGVGSEGPAAVVAHRMQMFLIRREQGRLAEIERDVIRVAREMPNRWVLGCVVASMEAALGRIADTRRALRDIAEGDFDRLPLDNEYLFALSVLPEACAVAGDEGAAATLYRLLLPWRHRTATDLQDADTGSIELPLGRLAIQLGRRDDAREHFAAAIAANDHDGAPAWAAWSRFELGRLLDDAPLLADAADAGRSMGLVVLERLARGG